MLQNLNKLIGYAIRATDGEIGKVDDFYFDDQEWTIRYLVVDTGPWLTGRKVLLLPSCLGLPNWEGKVLPVNVTMERIKDSPDIDTRKPVSRQHETELHDYYNGIPYWNMDPYTPMAGMTPGFLYPTIARIENDSQQLAGEQKTPANKPTEDPSLRSANEMLGYHIEAGHGSIGHIEDFIIDDNGWIIRYLSIDTRNWLPGKRVLIAPLWVSDISWSERKINVDLDRETIKNSPAYDHTAPITRSYEEKLSDYFCKPKYWMKNIPPR
ncbi:MAG: PRC-barrel domain-containing protein [Phycisphaerae bacterium]